LEQSVRERTVDPDSSNMGQSSPQLFPWLHWQLSKDDAVSDLL
jgi:hypothetical protein